MQSQTCFCLFIYLSYKKFANFKFLSPILAEAQGEKDMRIPSAKANSVKGKKRTQGSTQSDKERAEIRKRKLKQVCHVSLLATRYILLLL